MNIDFVELKTYLENKEENIFLKGFWYSTLIGFLLILVVVFSSWKKKDLYYENILIINGKEVILTVDYKNVDKITNSNLIMINDKTYYYKIQDVMTDSNMNNDYQIKILLDDNSLLMNNIILKYKILIEDESILEYIVRIVKGD